LRLDKELANFFAYLDQTVGKGNYLTFLTADHGGVNNATFLQDQRIPAGIWNKKGMMEELNQILKTKFNTDKSLVKTIMNNQVFFNTDIIEELGLDYTAIKQVVVDRLKKDKDVHYAFDMEKTSTESIPAELKFRAINGYNRERSGGVQIILKPAHYEYGNSRGTTHGAWNPYDIHIPCLFMGWGIRHGESAQPHYMTDIAATVCALLHIQAPNGCIGTPIF
ncbi:MAG: alkaline phosphatase family protein, partial [Prevotella sp.]|nr:alkaline phosphatase family protein [Prevotella sp.]